MIHNRRCNATHLRRAEQGRAGVSDPYTGTFLQTDPIPGADANAYGYTDGDPVNETDLTGQAAGAVALDAGGGAETGAVLCAWAGLGDVACAAGGALVGTAAGLVSDTFGGRGGSTGSLVSLGYHQSSSGAEVSPGGVVFAKRPQPSTPEEEQQAHDLAAEGNRILGSGHNPAKVPAWNDWWGGKTSRDKGFYDWAGGRRPARQ
jgi:hypothetical protein